MNDCLYQISNYEEKTIFTAKYTSTIYIYDHVIVRAIIGCIRTMWKWDPKS